MGNTKNLDGAGGGSGGPPNPIKPPSSKPLTGGSPGLLTSTGGLFGGTGALYAPFYNTITDKSYILVYDPSNFDAEEDASYYFPNPDSPNGVGRKVSIHKILLVYKEIGAAKFYVGIEAYISENDTYLSKEVLVNIAQRKKGTFPDNKIHTRKLSLVIDGERPQPYIRRTGNSGAFSIVKLTLCGNADEREQV